MQGLKTSLTPFSTDCLYEGWQVQNLTLNTEFVTDLDYQSEMIEFGSIWTTFELSSNLEAAGQGQYLKLAGAENRATIEQFSFPKSVKRSVE
jgi:hypothetical protein